MEELNLTDDKMCFACGENNQSGLKLRFSLHKNNTITTEFIPQKEHQGLKNIVHGGIISVILDETMANLNWKLGKSTLTGQLEVKFKSPALTGEKLICKASIVKEDKRIIYNQALLTTTDSRVIASANAKCVKINR